MTHLEAFEIAAHALVTWEQANGGDLQLATVRVRGGRANAICNAIAEALLEADFQAIQRYFHLLVDKASGVNLDELGHDHYDEQRHGATQAVAEVTFTRTVTTALVTILAGSIVRTVSGVRFTVDVDLTMGVGITTGASQVTAVDAGSVKAEPGTITVLENKPQGDLTVTNAARAAGGNPREEDDDFRERLRDGLLAVAGSLRGITKGALQVLNVRTARAYEDRDPQGLKSGSVQLIVGDRDGHSNSTMTTAMEAALSGWNGAGVPIIITGGNVVEENIKARVDWRDGFATPQNKTSAARRVEAAVSRLKANAIAAPADANADSKLTHQLILAAILGTAGALPTSEVLLPVGTVVPNKGEIIRPGSIEIV